MSASPLSVQAVCSTEEVASLQRLPYFLGISGASVGATGLSMHLVVIPPGAKAEPHLHLGYETGIFVLKGTVLTRWARTSRTRWSAGRASSCSFHRVCRTTRQTSVPQNQHELLSPATTRPSRTGSFLTQSSPPAESAALPAQPPCPLSRGRAMERRPSAEHTTVALR